MTDYDPLPDPILRRMNGNSPSLMHDGRTVPESMVHLVEAGLTALEAERDKALEEFRDAYAELEGPQKRLLIARVRYLASIDQLEATQKYLRAMNL